MSKQTKADSAFLVEKLGATITAVLAGARNRDLPFHWSAGRINPTLVQARRLSVAVQLWEKLVADEQSEEVARALFVGTWPTLGTSPVEFIGGACTEEEFTTVAASDGH